MGEKRLRLTVFFILFFLSLAGIISDLRGEAILKAFPPLEWTAGKLYTLADGIKETGVQGVKSLIRSVKGHLVSAKHLQKELQEKEILQRKVAELNRKLVLYKTAARENAKLKALLKVKERLEYKTIGAYVIGGNPSPWSNIIIINVGAKDGVTRDAPVLDEAGVVGKVVEVYGEWSKVLLLTDPAFAVHVMDARSGVIGVVKGEGRRWCSLEYVVEDRDVKPGDLLVTTGIARLYPKGYPVGTVVEIQREPGELFMKARVKPKARFSRMSYLLVVLPQEKSRKKEK